MVDVINRGHNGDTAVVGKSSFNITLSDTKDFPYSVRGVYVGTTGNVILVNEDGSTTTWTAVPAGFIIPCRARRVNNTSTTASNLVGIY